MAKHFYMFLPSTVNQDLFPDNTASRYRVLLPHSIDLREGTDQHWEVALTEIAFSHQLRTFINEKIIVRQLVAETYYRVVATFSPTGDQWTFDPARKEWKFDHGYFMLRFSPATPPAMGMRYRFSYLNPPNLIRFSGRAAYEMGFTDDPSKPYFITSSQNYDSVMEAAHSPPNPSRNFDYQLDVVRDEGWVLGVGKETVVPLPSAYYSSETALQEAITEELVKAGQGDQVKLSWLGKENRFQWEITNPENTKAAARLQAITEGARIEQSPAKSFSSQPVTDSSLRPRDRLVALYMTGDLAMILGMASPFTMAAKTKAVAPPDPDRGVFNIYVYNNISRPVIVGNMLVPLLRTVTLQRDNKNTLVTYTFKRPYYIPVDTDILNTLEILLCDDLGVPVPFFRGRTQAVLHFRLMPGPSTTAAESLER